MVNRSLLIVFFFFLSISVLARDGMWIPKLVKMNIAEMHEMGCNLDADDIYSETSASLKDAIVQFGSGCTGSIISPNGLVVTNYHCSHKHIQALSSLEKNYLANGYWAYCQENEIPANDLSVTFLIRMEDVTKAVIEGIDTVNNDKEKRSLIRDHISKLENDCTKEEYQKANVKPFFQGNRYFLLITETFNDIRLVGAPPESIGKFGGDTDNWMWPRHTGDFTLFRIYADSSNHPSTYSTKNVPFKAKKFLPINLKGINEGDFTLVYGFPGSTQSYLPASSVELIQEQSDPDKIAIRNIRLQIMNDVMLSNLEDNFKYSAKYALTSNAWKKWEGEINGLRRFHAIEKKEKNEESFTNWLKSDSLNNYKYQNILPQIESLTENIKPYQKAYDYYIEIVLGGIEANSLCNYFRNKKAGQDKSEYLKTIENHFKNQSFNIERKCFTQLATKYISDLPPEFLPDVLLKIGEKKNPKYLLQSIYDESILTNKARLGKIKWVYKNDKLNPKIEKDQLYQILTETRFHFKNVVEQQYWEIKDKIDNLQKLYIEAILKMDTSETLAADANLTLRFSYGKVEGYNPRDAITYNYFSTTQGILEKATLPYPDYYITDDWKNYLKTNSQNKFMSADSTVHTCFVASNHTTGGNSGSPVIDANGNLIGINFDRCWESTMSDILFEPSIARNISLDVHYMLYVIDRFAGKNYLFDEMKIME